MAQWLKHFALNAVVRMRMQVARGVPCAIEAYDPQNNQTPCPDTSAFLCVVCRRACCPAHAFLAWTGDAICPGCVGQAQRAGQGNPYGRPPPGHAPPGDGHGQRPPQDPREQLRAKIAEAHAVLDLPMPSSWLLVEAKWKQLLRDNHPDRFPPEQRTSQEERTKRINAAYQFLKAIHDADHARGAA